MDLERLCDALGESIETRVAEAESRVVEWRWAWGSPLPRRVNPQEIADRWFRLD